ncbi:glycosyltransferase [Allosaccharopolyspora coralli]|uniref:Glycosyltransferase n=1 Tax=Allosaccharopolyspora coralli TaxID=2665642 RepID=A0A5Q3QKK2_9PSEU|nr:glycosyltransferase [Allosaccharopolyspora coralli]
MLLLNWRDTGHPAGGGSERYVEQMAHGLARRGYRVDIQCAAYPHAGVGEWRDGVRYRRRGSTFSVYAHALLASARTRADVVIDVQNGMPFLSKLVARCPVVVLVHHVHREQWASALGSVFGRVGWWIESWLAPKVYRKCRYVTVSEVTRSELAELGVDPARVEVVPNGLDPVPAHSGRRAPEPTLAVVSRLVPHKRVEHAIDVLALLGQRWPTLRLDVVGQGPWENELREYARTRGVERRVTFHGWVEEHTKHEILARSWLHLCPSVKEGWGIVIMEAAAHGVPSLAYRSAGGVTESIVEDRTGLLADDFDEFADGVERLLADAHLRRVMGEAATTHAGRYRWEDSVAAFESLVRELTVDGPDQRVEPVDEPVGERGGRPLVEVPATRPHGERGGAVDGDRAEGHA